MVIRERGQEAVTKELYDAANRRVTTATMMLAGYRNLSDLDEHVEYQIGTYFGGSRIKFPLNSEDLSTASGEVHDLLERLGISVSDLVSLQVGITPHKFDLKINPRDVTSERVGIWLQGGDHRYLRDIASPRVIAQTDQGILAYSSFQNTQGASQRARRILEYYQSVGYKPDKGFPPVMGNVLFYGANWAVRCIERRRYQAA